MAEVRRAKKGNKPVNAREYLNTAATLANDILEGLRPVVEAAPDGILDRDTRETLKLAMETLRTCRELQLKSKALDHQIKLSTIEQQQAMTHGQNPLLAQSRAIEAMDTEVLVELAKKQSE